MKIKAVAGLCAKAKQIVILDQGRNQWIGDGNAVYAMPENFPELNEGNGEGGGLLHQEEIHDRL